ncbi:MAG: Ribonuclease [Actinomycetota bacterium]
MLAVRLVPDAEVQQVHVAFATPRRLGSAVTRNRLRRQLRELMRARAAHLPTGWYLLSVHDRPVDITWGQLGQMLDTALGEAQQRHQPTQVSQ